MGKMSKKKKIITKDVEEKILLALYRYYLSDITFERAAEEAGVPIYLFIKYVNDNNFPIVHTDKDIIDGLHKVIELMKEMGIETRKLPVPV
jgi:predicted HTH domain antitoxin